MALCQSITIWILLLSALGSVSSQRNETGIAGMSVNLTVSLAVPENHLINWNFKEILFITIFKNNIEIVPAYIDRCRLIDFTTVELFRLTAADQGEYTVSITNFTSGSTDKESIYLTVYSQLNTPVLYVENLGSGLINGTNVTLRCDAGSQTVTDYIFSGSKENICSENHVTCNQNLLHFHPITDSDNGNYTCTIQNPISKNTSAPLVLTVQVPVSNVTLSSNATTDLLWVDKDFVSLTCSAFGTNVVYSWSLNGIPLSQDSRYHLSNGNSTLIISPVSRKDNGSFTCTASNSVNNETSKPLKLQLAWFPDGPIVYDITRNGNNLTLLCSWPGGNPAANVTMIFQNINETQQDQVTRNVSYDSSLNEVLICLGAQLGLEVNNSVTIELPKLEEQINSHNSVVAGGSVIMTVILMSNRNGRAFQPRSQILPSTFSWFHLKHQSTPITTGGRFTVISSDYKSSLEITEVTENENGDYECIAENAVGSSTFYFVLNVTAKQESSVNNGLGAGEIAGIVVGVLAGVALIGIIAFFILKSKKKKSKKENTRINVPVSQSGPADKNPEEDDIKYAEIKFKNNSISKAPIQTEPETEYSTIKSISNT